jgi:type IV fimbrial biogenesis protein FimT
MQNKLFATIFRDSRQLKGYTLLELMIVLIIVSLVLAVGLPGFHGMIQGQRLNASVNDFLAALHLTRSEAIQRGQTVTLVPAAAAGWSAGWRIFIDGDGNLIHDEGEELIFSHGPMPAGVAARATFTDMSASYISYQPNGRTRTRAQAARPQFGNILFSSEGETRKIVINSLGRVRACNPVRDGSTC